MNEDWMTIPEFPDYAVSNLGRVVNQRTDRILALGSNNYGHMKVNLREGGITHTVSLARLVAEAFVEPPDDLSDHVILLDGDLRNVSAYNLQWRPRWFAWKYARQMRTKQHEPYHVLQICNVSLGRFYPSIIDCGMEHGLLFYDIWRSANRGGGVYPYSWTFKFVDA